MYHILDYLRLNVLQFAAKRSAICCKTQCVLVLNAVCFGAKRKAKCGKMQVEKHKYTPQMYKQNLLETSKTGLKRTKQPLKSRFLGVKSGLLGLKNYMPATKLERQNGTKRRFCP